jgi:membrane fusion protein (multidrug efflux system)
MTQPVESDQTSLPADKPAVLPPHGKLWRLLAVATVVAAILIAVFVAGRLPRLRQHELTTRESSELAIPVVTVVSPTPGRAASGLLLPAEVKPWIETPIHARASGYLKRWLVDLGARVETGQLLCEIETPELDQELERARHELAQAEAALGLAKTVADRSAKLVEPGGVSREEYDQDQAEVKVKTATVSAARASVRRLEELHSFARVTAPFSGIITARKTDVGDLIAAGSTKELFRLAQVDRLRVRVRVPQSRSLAITLGQTAELLVPELPGKVFAAKVARTAGSISPDSRTLLTELEVDNTRGELLAGGFAQVRFADTKGDGALTLPSNTLLFRGEGPQVGVVQADGTVQLRSVKLGRDFGRIVEILAGVGPADRVILNPSDSLAPGTVVRIAEPAKPEKSK